jgi:RNA polymerase-interacting CarD/CdnL/TRCF family regulator
LEIRIYEICSKCSESIYLARLYFNPATIFFIQNYLRNKEKTLFGGEPMTEIFFLYSIGDWVVHCTYGIGQIKKVEVKPIDGELVPCFQVKTQNGAQWWFPQKDADNPRVRPIASQEVLQRAQEELQEPVQELDPDKNLWKHRIDEVIVSGDFIAITQIVRDLTVLQTQRRLNQIEAKSLSLFKNRLLREWSATMDTDIEAIRPKLKRYLKVCKERAIA